ncbi:MAG TPA: signal peptide peptidase SppA [Syntrophothermus lipocalidus]|uniref:signal peptide peptidase SppA n=1 Tax=Syntrophothermus sp. TaxID=2736299 RepID=UPI00178E9145|nr:signal peptide peptidase SppA [Syntrophothermus sp.]NSW82098.1 signal peptide peptidase SppA [Syntrophothermus sp.]HHV76254.1 signal peptide peptidase SppA [Syntrophothermus lipocalidus]
MRQRLVVGLIVAFCLAVLVLAVKWSPDTSGSASKVGAGGAIGVVRIEGVLSGASQGYGGATQTEEIMEALREAGKRDDIKAVLIRIDSPGGSAVAAQEIAREIERLKKKGKPLVASMGDVAASGGYWVAASCDEIFANPATTTGSIGVITEQVNLEELFSRMGIETEVIKSGSYKDMGSITRKLSPEERKLLEELVDDVYQQFLLQVEKGRRGKMSPDEIRAIADGRVMTGNKAKQIGLVDHLGNYYDALERTKELANLSGEPQVIELNPQDPFSKVFSQLLNSKAILQPYLSIR